jgi:RND superfamily putative drug exporter
MPRLTVATEPQDDGIRIILTGELDLACAYTFDARLREIEDREPAFILLDIRDLTFVDSAGLGRILAAHKRGRQAGRKVMLTRGTNTVQRVLAIAAVDQILEFAPAA